jgi:hypothetical protein
MQSGEVRSLYIRVPIMTMISSWGFSEIGNHPNQWLGYVLLFSPFLIFNPLADAQFKKLGIYLGMIPKRAPDLRIQQSADCAAFQFFTPFTKTEGSKKPAEPISERVREEEVTKEIIRPAKAVKPSASQVLGVSEDATAAEINRAYREKIKYLHPDVCAGMSDSQVRYYEALTARLNESRDEMLRNCRHAKAA